MTARKEGTMTNYEFDEAVRSEGYAVVCGVDEAGRWPARCSRRR